MSILELLRSDGSIVVNKKLAHAIGIDAAIMYSELISKHFYFENRDQITEDGFFFNTVENMQEDTALSKYQQSKAIKKLVELKLIFHENRGLPQKRYFKINNNELIIRKTLDIGQKLKVKNLTSKSEKTEQLEVKKVDSNNTNLNNPNLNNNKLNKGTEFNSARALSFDEIKNKYNIENSEIECIEYYLSLYKQYRGVEHPRLKEEQWIYVIKGILDVDGIELDDTSIMDMMDQHFITKYRNCDYNILHFMSEGVKLNRMFEVAYY
jgi:DNA-binding transcriptional regulator GbsR (MarR family)